MRKLIKHTIYLFILTFGFSSCVDFLDRVPDSVAYNDEEVFTDYTKSQEYINQLMTPFRYFDDNDIEGAYANTSYYGTHGKSCYGLRERITDNCIYNPKYSWHSTGSLYYQTRTSSPVPATPHSGYYAVPPYRAK